MLVCCRPLPLTGMCPMGRVCLCDQKLYNATRARVSIEKKEAESMEKKQYNSVSSIGGLGATTGDEEEADESLRREPADEVSAQTMTLLNEQHDKNTENSVV